MKITILGCGAYGLALSEMFSLNNCDITMWTILEEEKNELEKERTNKRVLPNFKVNKNIKFTTDMQEAIKGSNLIVIAIPVKFVNNVVSQLAPIIKKSQHICIASKGIEQGSLLFVSSIVNKAIKTKKIAVISGGTFAIDMVAHVPMGLTLATKNNATEKLIIKALQNKYLKLVPTKDIFGTEMYGAIKNVIAIASGMLDGLSLPESTKCMFITKSLNDVMNLIYSMGGNKKTILTYAGLGDLLLTCNSTKSRNYSLGKLYGEKKSKKDIEYYINNTTIEGLYTLKSIHELIHKNNLKMHIIDIIYDIIYNNAEITLLLDYLTK